MRALLQRVAQASVTTDDGVSGQIGPGLLVLLGVTHDDDEAKARKLAAKTVKLRIFADEEGKMNRSVLDTGGAVLAVSQFTLYADAKSGNRPSYVQAARPEQARPLFESFVEAVREHGVHVETGVFGEHMEVELLNDGPVTVWLDGEEL